MTGYFSFVMAYAGPFLLAAALFLLWAWISFKVRDKYPKYYENCIKVYENLPKIAGFLLIAVVIYLFFTTSSYYE